MEEHEIQYQARTGEDFLEEIIVKLRPDNCITMDREEAWEESDREAALMMGGGQDCGMLKALDFRDHRDPRDHSGTEGGESASDVADDSRGE